MREQHGVNGGGVWGLRGELREAAGGASDWGLGVGAGAQETDGASGAGGGQISMGSCSPQKASGGSFQGRSLIHVPVFYADGTLFQEVEWDKMNVKVIIPLELSDSKMQDPWPKEN